MAMPSITYSGAFSPLTLLLPRILIAMPPSGERETHTPGYLAASWSSIETVGDRDISSAVTPAGGVGLGDIGSTSPTGDVLGGAQASSSPLNRLKGTRTRANDLIIGELMHTGIRCINRSLLLGTISVALAGSAVPAESQPSPAQGALRVASPDGRNVVFVDVREGFLYYTVQRDGRTIMLPSRLGFEFRGARTLRDSLRLVSSSRNAVDNTWTQPWGEVARVRDHHNELKVSVLETVAPGRRFDVAFRAFNDGVAFRYELPAQPSLGEFTIRDELTEFSFADDARAWWIPSDVPRLDRSEMLYASSPVSVIDSIQTPLTAETRDGKTFIVIHEANLIDYARMNLAGGREQNRTLRAALAPHAGGDKVHARTPFNTPWRTIQLADRAIDLAPSVLGLNLNPPNVLGDVSWVKPMKYVGIWWGMHINTMTWHSGPKHGATTANTKRYIDFAAANGIGGVLVEGWNTGWDGDWIQNRNAFSFTQAYPDYDLAEVARYAHEKGVKLIAHNETSGGVQNYERQMEA